MSTDITIRQGEECPACRSFSERGEAPGFDIVLKATWDGAMRVESVAKCRNNRVRVGETISADMPAARHEQGKESAYLISGHTHGDTITWHEPIAINATEWSQVTAMVQLAEALEADPPIDATKAQLAVREFSLAVSAEPTKMTWRLAAQLNSICSKTPQFLITHKVAIPREILKERIPSDHEDPFMARHIAFLSLITACSDSQDDDWILSNWLSDDNLDSSAVYAPVVTMWLASRGENGLSLLSSKGILPAASKDLSVSQANRRRQRVDDIATGLSDVVKAGCLSIDQATSTIEPLFNRREYSPSLLRYCLRTDDYRHSQAFLRHLREGVSDYHGVQVARYIDTASQRFRDDADTQAALRNVEVEFPEWLNESRQPGINQPRDARPTAQTPGSRSADS